jgi:hypothetical protein
MVSGASLMGYGGKLQQRVTNTKMMRERERT